MINHTCKTAEITCEDITECTG